MRIDLFNKLAAFFPCLSLYLDIFAQWRVINQLRLDVLLPLLNVTDSRRGKLNDLASLVHPACALIHTLQEYFDEALLLARPCLGALERFL